MSSNNISQENLKEEEDNSNENDSLLSKNEKEEELKNKPKKETKKKEKSDKKKKESKKKDNIFKRIFKRNKNSSKPRPVKKRKVIVKGKVIVAEKLKFSNLWGVVLFYGVIIGCVQLAVVGVINIIKYGVDDKSMSAAKNTMNKDSNIYENEVTILYSTDFYGNESPTETDSIPILTSLPTETSMTSPSYNDLFEESTTTTTTSTTTPENSKRSSEIVPTSIPMLNLFSTKNENLNVLNEIEKRNENNTTSYFNNEDEKNEDIFDENSIIYEDKINNNDDYDEFKYTDNNDINNVNEETPDNKNTEEEDEDKKKKKEKIKNIILKILVYVTCYGSSIILTFYYYKLALNHTDKIFIYTFYSASVASILFCLVVIVFGFYRSVWIYLLGYFIIIPTILILRYIKKYWEPRMKFSETFLNESLSAIRDYPQLFMFSMINFIFKAALDFLIVYAFYAALISRTDFYGFDENNSLEIERIGYLLFLLFSYYYSTNVVQNITFVTTSTLYAYYLFNGQTVSTTSRKINSIERPVRKSFLRANTYLIGSIAAISLVMTVFNSMEYVLKIWKKFIDIITAKGQLFKTMYDINKYILDFLDYISDIYSSSSLVELAIYGKSVTQSCENAYCLMKENKIYIIYNDLIIKSLLVLAEVAIIALSAILSMAICAIFGKFDIENFTEKVVSDLNNYTLSSFEVVSEYVLLAAFGTKAIFSSVFAIIDSSVVTLFMSILRDPKDVSEAYPDLYKKLVESRPNDLGENSEIYEQFLSLLNNFNEV